MFQSGGPSAVPLALFVLPYEGVAARAAVRGSATTGDERRLMDTAMAGSGGETGGSQRRRGGRQPTAAGPLEEL